MNTVALKTISGEKSRRSTAVHLARRLFDVVGTWHRRRQSVSALMALDDHTLKDIGLHRSEILSAVYHPRG